MRGPPDLSNALRYEAGESARSRRRLGDGERPTPRLPRQPAQQHQGALGIEAGRASLETFLNALAGDAQQAGEVRLAAADPHLPVGSIDEDIPHGRGRTRSQRAAAPATGKYPPAGAGRFADREIGGFEHAQDNFADKSEAWIHGEKSRRVVKWPRRPVGVAWRLRRPAGSSDNEDAEVGSNRAHYGRRRRGRADNPLSGKCPECSPLPERRRADAGRRPTLVT